MNVGVYGKKTSISRVISDDFVLSHSVFKDVTEHTTNSMCFDFEYNISYYINTCDTLCSEGKIFNLGPNTIVITPPGNHYSQKKPRCGEVDRYHIRFNSKILTSDIIESISDEIMVFTINKSSVLAECFKKIDYYCANFEGEQLKIILIHVIEEIVYNLVLCLKNNEQMPVVKTDPMMEKIVAYVDKNIRKNFTLDDMCKALFISKGYLHRLLVSRLGISPKKYILQKKLSMIRMDIQNGKSPTKIYTEYGFSNYSTFYRAYKINLGHSPSDDVRM